MRTPLILLAALAAACDVTGTGQSHPTGRLYFPTGLAHVDSAGEGTLYVVNSNFDRRFNNAQLTGVDLGALGLPAFPGPGGDIPEVPLPQSADSEVRIRNFGGDVAAWPLPDGRMRLFVATREEGSFVHVVHAQGAALDCGTNSRTCSDSGFSLEDPSYSPEGKPRAPQPYQLALSPTGTLYITHLGAAHQPAGTGQNPEAYLVAVNAADPVVTADSFLSLGSSSVGNSLVVGSRYVYLSGRLSPDDVVVRTVEPTEGRVSSALLKTSFSIAESRGLALSPDEQRLYIGGRGPDMLLVAQISGPASERPGFTTVRAVPTPAGLNDLKLIPRAGRGSLVVATCTAADSLIIYDEDAGQIVSNLSAVGSEPFAVAVDERGAGARLYVSAFGDGQVSVVDIPDLGRPQEARVVAKIGRGQLCLLSPNSALCGGER